MILIIGKLTRTTIRLKEKYIHSDQYNNFSVVIGSYGIVDESQVMTINNHSKLLYNYLNNPVKLGSSPFEKLDSGVLTLGNVSSSWNEPDIELIHFRSYLVNLKLKRRMVHLFLYHHFQLGTQSNVTQQMIQ